MAIEDIDFNKPVWILNKNWDLTLPDNPFSKLFDGVKTFFGDTKTETINLSEKKKEIFNRGMDIYRNLKAQKGQVTQGLTEAIQEFADDLEATGVKFYIPTPFRGTMSTARYVALDSLDPTKDNFPNFSDNSYVGAMAVIASAGNFTQIISMLTLAILLYVGKENPAIRQLQELIETPLFSPLGNSLKSDPAFVSEFNRVKNSGANSISSAVKLTGQFVDDFNNIYENNTLSRIVSEVNNPTTVTTSPTAQLIQEIVGTRQTALGDLDIPSGEIEAGALYEVVGYTNVSYNGQGYTDGQVFRGRKNVLTYVTTGTGIVKKIEEPNVIKQLGKRFTDSTDATEVLEDFEPYDRWFNLLTFGDLFKGIGDWSNFGVDAIKQINGFASDFENGILSTANYVNQVTDLALDKVEQVAGSLEQDTERLEIELGLLSFNVLGIPPTRGGIDQLRYAFNQWLDINAENAPVLDRKDVNFMIILVFGGQLDLGLTATMNKMANLFGVNFQRGS